MNEIYIARIATSSRQLAEIRVLLYGMRIIEFITAFNCSSSWHKISLYACANVGNKYCILFNKLNIETECEQPIKKTLEKTGEKNSDTNSRFEKRNFFLILSTLTEYNEIILIKQILFWMFYRVSSSPSFRYPCKHFLCKCEIKVRWSASNEQQKLWQMRYLLSHKKKHTQQTKESNAKRARWMGSFTRIEIIKFVRVNS